MARLMKRTNEHIQRKISSVSTRMVETWVKEVETTLMVTKATSNASREEKNEKLTIMYFKLLK